MFEENNQNLFQDNAEDIKPTEYAPTNRLRKQIERLMAEEKAQQSRTWSFYEDLRKREPSKYWSSKSQKQMHQDAADLGERFNDGDVDG